MSIYPCPEPWPVYLDYPFHLGGSPRSVREECALWDVAQDDVSKAAEKFLSWSLPSFAGDAADVLAETITKKYGAGLAKATQAIGEVMALMDAYADQLTSMQRALAEHRDAAQHWHLNWDTAAKACRQLDAEMEAAIAVPDAETAQPKLEQLADYRAELERCIRQFGMYYDNALDNRTAMVDGASHIAAALLHVAADIEECRRPPECAGPVETSGLLEVDPDALIESMLKLQDEGLFIGLTRHIMWPLAEEAVDDVGGSLVAEAHGAATAAVDAYLSELSENIVATTVAGIRGAELWKAEEWNLAQRLWGGLTDASTLTADVSIDLAGPALSGVELGEEIVTAVDPTYPGLNSLTRFATDSAGHVINARDIIMGVQESTDTGMPAARAAAVEVGSAAMGAKAENVVKRRIAMHAGGKLAERLLTPKLTHVASRAYGPVGLATSMYTGAVVAEQTHKLMTRTLDTEAMERRQAALKATGQASPTPDRPT